MSFEAVNSTTFTEVLYPKSIFDIIDFFVRECIRREMRFRVCKHCNQFFALAGHANTEYCDRPLSKIPKEAFYEWAEEARKRRDLCVKGEIPVEDFKLWLEE